MKTSPQANQYNTEILMFFQSLTVHEMDGSIEPFVTDETVTWFCVLSVVIVIALFF